MDCAEAGGDGNISWITVDGCTQGLALPSYVISIKEEYGEVVTRFRALDFFQGRVCIGAVGTQGEM